MLRSLIVATSLALLLPAGAALAETPKAAPAHKADLADRVAGTYTGNVASDARGSSRNNVTITVTRTGPNKIEIKSDYPRIPTVTIPLEKGDGRDPCRERPLCLSPRHGAVARPARPHHRRRKLVGHARRRSCQEIRLLPPA